MNFIGCISTDVEVKSAIESIIEKNFSQRFKLQLPGSEKEIFEFLNFEMPEIVIVDFSDSEIHPEIINTQILEDSWLHSFGIIGIFSKEKDTEQELLDKFKHLNLLTLIEKSRLKTHLAKTMEIIYNNRQLIFQGWVADKLVNRVSGSFIIENTDIMVVSVYTGLLALNLVRLGVIPSLERYDLQVAMTELAINGIEHGNCGIDYEAKTKYLMSGGGMHELIMEKNADPDVAWRKVILDWEISEGETRINIKDDGDGFDVVKYKQKLKEKKESGELHGRGILMAQMVADKIFYNKKGNKVALIKNRGFVENAAPAGFSGEEVITLRKGDPLVEAGEFADCLFYISSGKFTVYYNGQPVGKITPADIFMGEMAFLLNNTRSATVIADSDAKVIKIPRKSFITVIKEYPQYGIFLAKLLAQKLVRSNESVSALGKQGRR